MSTPRRAIRPTAEALEDRTVPAAVSLRGATVTIHGDSWRNLAVVKRLANGNVQVRVDSRPQGSTQRPTTVTRLFPFASVRLIRFHGQGANDAFVLNVAIPCVADGGTGHDYLKGSNAGDVLRGNLGNDTLYGYGGNDALYGGANNDVLYGMSGNDGLFGGEGLDAMHGGVGSDRFLQFAGVASEARDFRAVDAVVLFRNAGGAWSENEIMFVDYGLRILHQRTGNDNLLERSNGAAITFLRGATSDLFFAVNHENGAITVYSRTFANSTFATSTILHEMAHNWDDPGEMSPARFSQWLGLSVWRRTPPPSSQSALYGQSFDGRWYHLLSAPFAYSYGRTNPYEDFATAWEKYFQVFNRLPDVQNMRPIGTAKTSFLTNFFNSLFG